MKSTTYTKSELFISSEPEEKFKDRLSYLIESKGISKSWLAEKLGISRQALNYLLKHSNKPKYVDEISDILDISPQWLETGEGTVRLNKNTESGLCKIPVINDETSSQYINGVDVGCSEYILIDGNQENFIAFKISNDSIFPPFIEGTILVFDKNIKYKHGDYLLISDKDNNFFVRKVIIEAGREKYVPSSTDLYESFSKKDSVKILGTLVQSQYNVK